MFLQVPPAGFNKSLLPTQSRSSPALQHYKHLYFQNYDKKTSLNSYTIIASKCFVFVLRCSESPLSPMFFTVTPGLCFFSFNVVMVPSFNPNNLLAGQYLSSCNKWHLVPSASYQNVRHFMRCGKIGMVPQMVHRSVEPLRTNSCLLIWKDSWKKKQQKKQRNSVAQQLSAVSFSVPLHRRPCWGSDVRRRRLLAPNFSRVHFLGKVEQFQSHKRLWAICVDVLHSAVSHTAFFFFLLDRWSCKISMFHFH